MIADQLLLFSNGQTVTGTDTNIISTDKVDLSMARDLGDGETLSLLVTVTTAFSGAGTVRFGLAVSPNADMSSSSTVVQSGPYASAQLVAHTAAVGAGTPATKIVVPLPGLITAISGTIGATGARYLSGYYTITGAISAGAIRAELVKDIQMLDGRTYYSKNFTIV
jgi:hypothetical protein